MTVIECCVIRIELKNTLIFKKYLIRANVGIQRAERDTIIEM